MLFSYYYLQSIRKLFMTISFGLHYSIEKKVNLCQGNGQHIYILYTSMKFKENNDDKQYILPQK